MFRVAKGIQRYLMCSHMVANSCGGSPRVFHGILNRNEFYLQYPEFHGTEGICRYSKFDLNVSIWLRKGIALPLNTIKYHQILYENSTKRPNSDQTQSDKQLWVVQYGEIGR